MPWPDDTLDLVVGAYISGDWRDLSDRLTDTTASITRGGRDGSPSAAASSGSVTLRDDDGALTPYNPLGQWYPDVDRGMPMRLAVRRVFDTFQRTLTGSWGTSPDGTVWATSPSYSMVPGEARVSLAAAGTLTESYLDVWLRDIEQVSDVKVPAPLTGAVLVAGHHARRATGSTPNSYWLRLEMKPGGATVLKISKRISGVHTELAVLDPVPGLTYAAGTYLRFRSSVTGSRLSIKAWNPASAEPRDWMLTAEDLSLPGPGRTGLATWLVSGNTNATPLVVAYANYQLLVPRLTGDAVSYRPTLVPTTDGTLSAQMQIQIGSLLRRLTQGSSPLRSALTRYIPSTSPVAWWPMEDGVDSDQVASGVPGKPPMIVAAGTVEFSDDGPAGSAGSLRTADDLVPLAGQIIGGSASLWSLGVWVRAVRDDVEQGCTFLFAGVTTTTGLVVTPYVNIDSGGALDPHFGVTIFPPGYPDVGTATNVQGVVNGCDGNWHLCQLAMVQNGAQVDIYLYFDGALLASGTRPSDIVGAPARIQMQAVYQFQYTVDNLSDWGVSHTTVHNGFTDTSQHVVGVGWINETAGHRMLRLAGETGTPMVVVGDIAETVPMGPQRPDTLVALLQECATADGGLLAEAAGLAALRYVTRRARYNRAVDLAVDLGYPYAARSGESGRVLQPVYDDQGLRNDVTASRTDGSSARVEDAVSIARHGRYDTELTINVARDGLLPDIAGWQLHLGTVTEPRYPQVPLDLAANPHLVDAWLSADLSARIRRTGSLAPQLTIPDQVMVGYTETLGPRRWDVTAVCQPASPWDVAVRGVARRDTSLSTLNAPFVAGTDTTLSVATTLGPAWTTDPANYPMDLSVDGIRVTVSACSGAASPQTFTVTSAAVAKTIPAGRPVRLWTPAVRAL